MEKTIYIFCFGQNSSSKPYCKSHWIVVFYLNQFSSVAQSCPTLWFHGLQHTRRPCPSPTPGAYSNSCPSRQWCHPTISSSVVPFFSHLQSFPASGSLPMSWLVLHIRWPKYWSFSFSINPSNEYSGLISFRMDWLDLLAVQGTLKSLVQHHNLKASILQHPAFFIVQLSHPYMTIGKTIALTRRTFVGYVQLFATPWTIQSMELSRPEYWSG